MHLTCDIRRHGRHRRQLLLDGTAQPGRAPGVAVAQRSAGFGHETAELAQRERFGCLPRGLGLLLRRALGCRLLCCEGCRLVAAPGFLRGQGVGLLPRR